MSPPDSSALLRAIDSPSPMPLFLNEMVGWNSEARACRGWVDRCNFHEGYGGVHRWPWHIYGQTSRDEVADCRAITGEEPTCRSQSSGATLQHGDYPTG